jgi:hypothetical protein
MIGWKRAFGEKEKMFMHIKTCIFVITCSVLIFASCAGKSAQAAVDKANAQAESATDKENGDAAPRFSLVPREYFGTIAKTPVTDDDVNIRRFPDVSSESIGKVNKGDLVEIRGFSLEQDEIDGYRGYWVKVSVADRKDGHYRDNFGRFGWIFSKFVDVDPNVAVSKMRVIKVNPKTDRQAMSLILEMDRNGEKTEAEVLPHQMANQSFYTFVWSDDMPDFTYSDPSGTFKWIPDANEIRHVTYMGSDCESAWCLVTDDARYLFQDYGTSPGPRGLGVFDITTNKEVFSGSYYHDLEYDGKSVTIVKVYDSWNVESKYIDEQSILRAKEFIKNTPMTQEDTKWKNDGGGVDVIVRYRLDLATGEQTFIDCNYIHVQ